ncbi:MAG: class I SAM-dependent methyltransferase [Planctomycetes bacterium]|nr:class I SAM-dependent methyltransferase [Planctomycetota bacterium]
MSAARRGQFTRGNGLDRLTRALVEGAVAVLPPRGPVLEIGSRQVQNLAFADLRPLFPGLKFVGCDMHAGPGVDRIERLEALSFPDGWAGTVLCLNVLEHAWEVDKGIREIHRVTAPGGMALVSTVFNLDIHAYPDDYWRFTPQALLRLMGGFETVLYGWQGHDKSPRLVFAWGLRERRPDAGHLADTWRREILAHWHEQPSLWQRIGAGVGGALFGKRYFRNIRHWWDLTVRAGRAGESG